MIISAHTVEELSSLVSSLFASDLDGSIRLCSPFSPGAAVHAYAWIFQQIPQDKRCLARPNASGAVGDDTALGTTPHSLKICSNTAMFSKVP